MTTMLLSQLAKEYIKKLNSNAKAISAWSHILCTERKEAGNYYIAENITLQMKMQLWQLYKVCPFPH